MLTLAIGLGSPATIFSIVHAVLLRSLPYTDPDRLVSLSHTLDVGSSLRVAQTDASILFYQRHNRVFEQFGGYRVSASAIGPVAGEDAERIAAGRVTSGVFGALRIVPLAGRLFTAVDDEPRARPVAILAERLWRRRFGGDPRLLHSLVTIDGTPREIVGIVADSVRFPSADTELWLPLGLDPAVTDSATFDYQAIARVKDGISREQAEADVQALLTRLPDEFPGRLTRTAIAQTHMRASVRPLAEVTVEGVASLLWIVLGAALFVLSAACANVTCLFLVRAEGRRKALAIQRTLGASRAAIALDVMSEPLLTAGIGGIAAAAIVSIADRLLRSSPLATSIPRLSEVRADITVLGAIAAAVVLLAISIGLATAWRSTQAAARPHHTARAALAAAQVAVAALLVVGSGLLARSVWLLRSVDPGFPRSGTSTFRLALPMARYPTADDAVRFFTRAIDEVSRVAGVEAAGAASKLPLENQEQIETAVFVDTRPLAPGSLPRLHPVAYVSPGYFTAIGIQIVEGHPFRPSTPPNRVLEAVVSRSFAQRYWPGDSPIGHRIRILVNGSWLTVVGVARDVRDGALDRPDDEMIYCPLLPPHTDTRWSPRDLALVVRASGDPAATMGPIRDAIRRLDPTLPVYQTRTVADLVASASARRVLVLQLVAAASGVALLLAGVGVYGVMSYAVSLRTREIGIRIALGEPRGRVAWIVTREGLLVSLIGSVVGLGAALGTTRVLDALLFGVPARDPTIFALSAALVVGLSAAASWIPGRRAAAVDPARALRID